MEYKGPDNIYWLFSSSAQAIAAFIGFLAAGFFFAYDRIDKQVEKDETLEDIYNVIKIEYYRRLKALFILTGLSVVLSLFVVYVNGYDLGVFGVLIKITVAILNILTIVWAIAFVIFIINPHKVRNTTQKLIQENGSVFDPKNDDTISIGLYLEKYIGLEKILRDIAAKVQISRRYERLSHNTLPAGEIIRLLLQERLINPQQAKELREVTKIRNLAAHGEMQNIDAKQARLVDILIKQMSALSTQQA